MSTSLREYIVSVVKWYKGHLSGWLLAIVAIGLNVASAYFVDDPSKSALVVRWSARLTLAAAVWVFLQAQYDAWKEQRDKVEELRSDLPRFDVAIEQMTIGIIQGSFDGINFKPWTYAAPLIRVLNLGAQSVVQYLAFKVITSSGNVIEGKPTAPPTELAMTDASGHSIMVPFGESTQNLNINPIQKGTIARGRLFVVFENLAQADIGGAGFQYEVMIRDAWYPKTPEYSARIGWRTNDEIIRAFPGMGYKAKMITPINLE